MSFKNLEQRFNENVNTLYAGATTKYAGGKASTNRTDAPLIVRAPGKGYWGTMESRSTPVRSTAQDVKRLTLFQLSPDGIRFLAKQQLLQTGNTFEFTRAINPVFVVGNAVPFLHIKRNLRPLTELIGKTDTSRANVKSMGQLQFSTYNKLKSKTSLHATFSDAVAFNRTSIGSALKNRLLAPLNALKDTVKGTISAFSPNQKRNIGELVDKWGKDSWIVSRPELSAYIPSIQKTLYEAQQVYATNRVTETIPTAKSGLSSPIKLPPLKKPSLGDIFSAAVAVTRQSLTANSQLGTIASTNTVAFIKYFDGADSLKTGTKNGNDVPSSAIAKRDTDGGQLKPKSGKISYIKDPSNKIIPNYETPYSPIPPTFDDPVPVSFAMGKEEPIQFRAFIKDLTETSTPQYQTLQYIGRVEKFINYTGIQRETSFKLAVIAFGPDELETVWRRINYLTGLTFPYGFTRGIMQPNIVRLTIGGVYTNQPGYVTALSTNFNEPGGSWDIDSDVPIGAVMDIRFTLIEKATKIASSPFYGITENSQGFDLSLNVPQVLNSLKPRSFPVSITSGSIPVPAQVRPITNVSARDFVNASRPIRTIAGTTNNSSAVG